VTYELSLSVLFQLLTHLKDRIVAQAVSCWPVSLAVRVRARDIPFWGLWWTKWYRRFGFPLSVLFHQCSVLNVIFKITD